MALAKEIAYDSVGESLFIIFEPDRYMVGFTKNSLPYEVFVDEDLLQEGTVQTVGVEIQDMENYNPDKVEEIPEEYRQAVNEAYYQYRPGKRKTA